MKRALILGPVRLLGSRVAQVFAFAELVNGNVPIEDYDVTTGKPVEPTSLEEITEILAKLETPIEDPLQALAKELADSNTYFVLPKHHRINQHPNDDWRGQGNRKKRIKRNDR